MGRLKDLIINIGASTKNLDKELGKTRNKLNGMTRNLQRVGRNMSAAVTAPLVGIAAASSKTFVDFEFAMAKVKAVSGATAEEFGMLEKQAKDLGASTMHTASSVAGLQLELSRLGFTAQETQNATASILDLATATDSDLGNAADVVGSTLRAFGMDAGQAGHLADVMAASFSGSALSMDSFSNAMQYVAPIAKSTGVSLEETSGMLAVLANNGIRGSKAGRALRRILMEMAKTGKPTMEALKDLAAQGLNVTDAFDEVGRSATTQLLILNENMGQVDALTESFRNSEGAARKMASVMEDTTHGAIKRAESAIEGAALVIGQNLAPHIEAAANKIAEMAASFAQLTPETQASIIKAAGFAAAIGPLLVILPQIITSLGMLRTALMFLMANPYVAALGLLIAGIVSLNNKIQRAKEEIQSMEDAEKNAALATKALADEMKAYHDQVDETKSINEKLADLTLPNVEQALGRVNGSLKVLSKTMGHAIGTQDLERIKELEEKFKSMETFGLTPLEAALQQYRQELRKAAEEEERAAGADERAKKRKEEWKKEFEFLANQRELRTANHIEFQQQIRAEEQAARDARMAQAKAYEQVEISIDPEEELEEFDESFYEFGRKLQRMYEGAEEFSKRLTESLAAGLGSIASSVGDMIGKIGAGTASLRDLGNTMLIGLADMAINIGKIAISTGIAIMGIKAALEKLAGPLAIAAGIALVALGSMVKGALAKKAEGMEAPKLAKGGLAYGETLATIGDNPGARTDPEVIAPLSKLKGMLGETHVTGSIRGRDIVLTQERGAYSRRRKFGN